MRQVYTIYFLSVYSRSIGQADYCTPMINDFGDSMAWTLQERPVPQMRTPIEAPAIGNLVGIGLVLESTQDWSGQVRIAGNPPFFAFCGQKHGDDVRVQS